MKRLLISLFLMAALPLMAQQPQSEATTDSCHEVLLQTSKGNILLRLYNETPRHRDNFLRLVKSGYYDGILFHRVIADFMVQTGDSTTRHAQAGDRLGAYSPDYSIPAEFVYPKYFQPPHVNPTMSIPNGHQAQPSSTSSGGSPTATSISTTANSAWTRPPMAASN